jgi:hypothetical protein
MIIYTGFNPNCVQLFQMLNYEGDAVEYCLNDG